MVDAPQTERPLIPKGGKLTLKCKNDSCFIDDLTITSKGGRPTRSPSCPHCAGPLEAHGGVFLPPDTSCGLELPGYHEATRDLFLAMGRPDLVQRLIDTKRPGGRARWAVTGSLPA